MTTPLEEYKSFIDEMVSLNESAVESWVIGDEKKTGLTNPTQRNNRIISQ